jgi:hypothetical protein
MLPVGRFSIFALGGVGGIADAWCRFSDSEDLSVEKVSFMNTSQCLSRKFAVLSVSLALSAAVATSRADTTSTWTNAAGGNNWSTAGNWSPNSFDPSNGNGGVNYAVIIGTPSPTVLDISVTIDALTLNSGGILNTNGGTTLTVNGNVTDNGTITINAPQNGASTILAFANSTVSGSGAIVLNYVTSNAQLNGTLTQAAGHTIKGFGEINAALTNNGTVNANINGQTLYLQSSNMTNSATFEATAGGSLYVSGIAVTQGASGQISAQTGSVVNFSGATVTGGTVTSAGTGVIAIVNNSTFSGVTNNGVVNIGVNNTLNITGNLVDNGIITVNSGQNGGSTNLTFNGGTLSGTGMVVLNYPGANSQLNGILTQSAGHTIQGWGNINAALTNNGVVNANINGQALYLQTSNMTNNAAFEATSGGTLYVSGITVSQGTSGQLLAQNNSAVDLTGVTVSNGTLNTSGTGVIQVVGNTTLSNVTNSGALNILVNNTLTIAGNLIDNGTITVNSGQNGGSTNLTFNGGTLSGSGTVVLNYPTANSQLNGTLTQSAGHTIQGWGNINAALTNNGVVNANISGQTLNLQTSNMTNNATFEATNNGTLSINSIVVSQGISGQISATTGAVVNLSSATIANGTLASGLFQVFGTSVFNTLTNAATVNIIASSTLSVNGNLTNNGTLNVNPAQNGGTTTLNFNGGTVSGTGSIVLGYSTSNAQLTGTLTTGASQTIQGEGDILATLTNNGTLNANYNNGAIFLSTSNMTNNALFESTGGGSLNINGITVTQGASGQFIAGTNSNVVLTNAIISHGVLNSTAGNATVATGYYQVFGTTTFDSLTNNAPVYILNSQTLNITGNLTNNGLLNVNIAQNGGTTILNFNGGTVSGTGSIVLGYSTSNAELNGTLTQTSTHSIVGQGEINAVLTNNGTVNANASGQTLFLQGSSLTNTQLLESTNSSNLQFDQAIVVNNTGGNITANGGSVTFANGAAVIGGTITAVSGSLISISSFNNTLGYTASLNGLTLATGTQVNVYNSNTLNILGTTFTNNGNILVNPGQNGGSTVLNVAGNTTLTGNGTVTLNYSTSNAQFNTSANDTVTQDVHHTIQGFGDINASLINNGTVNANVSGQQLILQTNNMTNNSLFEATGGGSLALGAITVTQGASGQILAGPSSTVNLYGARLSKGALNGTGSFYLNNSSTFDSLTNNSTVSVPASTTLSVTGNLVDNGAINLNPSQNGGAAIVTFNGGTLSGTGVVSLDYGNGNAQVNGSLTQAAGHTLQGWGQINATLTNAGTILGNVNGQGLPLYGPTTNTGLIKATGGGSVSFASTAILANGSLGTGTFQTDANSAMSFPTNFSLNNGIISLTAPSSSVTGITSLTNAGNLSLVANAGLTLSGSLTGTAAGAITGKGTVLANSYFGSLAITGGTARTAINGTTTGTSKLTKLTLAGSTNAWTSDFDLTNNKLIVEDSATHAATLAALQNQAFYGRTHATGITSSDLPAGTVIAVADNAAFAISFTNFGGQMVDGNSILVAPELLGDADFSGKVDLSDLNIVLNHLGVATSAWTSGNFDGAATIDLTDLNDVLNNLGQTYSNPSAVATPEPASLVMASLGSVALLSSRRRRSA